MTPTSRRKFVKRPTQAVVAVQLALDTPGFTYEKWGGTQSCQAGDWIVDNRGDVYTVDEESFARTYRHLGGGLYLKVAPVWAEVAAAAGSVRTKEGVTHYAAGDYLVSNEASGDDTYAVAKNSFETMYEPAPDA
jgi:hypothetical protein